MDNRSDTDIPLCVDLDGTLVKTDTILEMLLLYIRGNPFRALQVAWWLRRGRAYAKKRLGEVVIIQPELLPYREDLRHFLEGEHARKRPIFLTTGSVVVAAEAIADHLGLFAGVLASEDENLTGLRKARRLSEKFGHKGFDYVGNSYVDIPVWKQSRQGLVAGSRPRLAKQAALVTHVPHTFIDAHNYIALWCRAARCHQWVKNFLLFVPILLAHEIGDVQKFINTLLAFGSFCFVSSSVYLINDLLDLNHDRQHLRKRGRPLAAGDMMPHTGMLLAAAMLVVGFGVALLMPPSFIWWLLVYFGVTVFYSLYFKQVVLIDVVVLALLYTVRIFAGGAAAEVLVSAWLMVFSLFLFMSLALVKRFVELQRLEEVAQSLAPGRGYRAGDLVPIGQLGAASGYLSALVLTLYISSPEVLKLYERPELLWLLVPLILYWVSRIWIQAYRGEVHDDPLVQALQDQASYVVGILALVIIILAR